MPIGIYTGQIQVSNPKEFRKCSLIKGLITFQGCKLWLINIIWVEIWKECNVFSRMNMIFSRKLGCCHLSKMISKCSSQKRKLKLLLSNLWHRVRVEVYFWLETLIVLTWSLGNSMWFRGICTNLI